MVEAAKPAVKRTAPDDVGESNGPSNKIRRVQPTKIGEVTRTSSKDKNETEDELKAKSDLQESGNSQEETSSAQEDENGDTAEDLSQVREMEAGPSTSTHPPASIKNTLTEQLKNLIVACRLAEPSPEMRTIIKTKLLKYYHSVHPDFVTSKNFLKSIKATTEEITKSPHLVYASLKVIIDELNARRKSKATVLTNEETVDGVGTGDEEKDARLKALYKALVKCKRTIMDLDEAEVDWEDDDNSSYLKKVRFEKRACEIYDKVKISFYVLQNINNFILRSAR